ncbi:MAG: U32 family peptidase [Bacteroidales bacterium]|nr:U32 family peptidase [Clostridium sp.]MCM1203089.1 U32 family peptidase [Bacteroidales bacterium]
MMIPEILAPAGSMEALKAAVHAGADAVYLGGSRFGARAYADNFSEPVLLDAIQYCHLYGVKVYLTVNTLFRNEEIAELYAYLAPFYEAGVDAVIVQDLGAVVFIHENFPDLPIHASTQMTVTTPYAYKLLKEYGVTRIVPARELSLTEIRQLKEENNSPEVEVFVQGALCYCYSGQCLMSSMLGGRSGNRGRCAQTCRLPYRLMDETGKIIKTKGSYLLSPKDLCGLESVPELIAAGVDSFKIEGRMKRPEYVAVCVRAYRRVLDAWQRKELSEELIEKGKREMAEVFNRGGFTEGYYRKKNGGEMMSLENPGNMGVSVGEIIRTGKNRITVSLCENVSRGDILVPEARHESVTLTSNMDGRQGETITLNTPGNARFYENQRVRRMWNKPLMDELAKYSETDRKIPLWGTMELRTGCVAKLTLGMRAGGREYSVTRTGEVVQKASGRPVTEKTVLDKVGKMGNTRYNLERLDMHIDGDAFYPLKALKELRRSAVEKLEQEAAASGKRRLPERKQNEAGRESERAMSGSPEEKRISAMVSDFAQYHRVKREKRITRIYLDMQYFSLKELRQLLEKDKSCFVVLPPVLRSSVLKELEELPLEEIPGIMVRNLDELAYLNHFQYRGTIVTDYSLYAMNDYAAEFIRRSQPGAEITVPVELNRKQLNRLGYLGRGSEIEVYGYQQLMVSAQCMQAAVGGCNQNNSGFIMKDRLNKSFFVRCNCRYCYNIIYNGIPTVLMDLVENEEKLNRNRRIHFITEEEREISEVFDALFCQKAWEGEKTRGHYNRGVE